MALAEPFPSNPRRPTAIGIYVTHDDNPLVNYIGFNAPYAAANFVALMIAAHPYDFHKDDIIREDGVRLSTRDNGSPPLKSLVDFKPSKEEQAFVLPEHYLRQYSLVRADMPPVVPKTTPAVAIKAPKVRKERSQTVSDGVALADIAAECNVTPADARAALRKASFVKPSSSWLWPTDHPDIEKVKKIIKSTK